MPSVPSQIGKYTVVRKIRDRKDCLVLEVERAGKHYVMKLFHKKQDPWNEINCMKVLKGNKNWPTFHEVVTHKTPGYNSKAIVEQLLGSRYMSLKQFAKQPLSDATRVDVTLRLVDALKRLHQHGISNFTSTTAGGIMINQENLHVSFVDFEQCEPLSEKSLKHDYKLVLKVFK